MRENVLLPLMAPVIPLTVTTMKAAKIKRGNRNVSETSLEACRGWKYVDDENYDEDDEDKDKELAEDGDEGDDDNKRSNTET